MALLSVIRRWYFREERSIREISRTTGLSRNTVRKYLRLGGVEPKFRVPDRPSKLDPFADRLSAWLKTEANKSRKQKRTLKQLHADLVSLGYEGSYNRVAAFAREWKEDRQKELQTSGRGQVLGGSCWLLSSRRLRGYGVATPVVAGTVAATETPSSRSTHPRVFSWKSGSRFEGTGSARGNFWFSGLTKRPPRRSA